jgi:hypothetical protein
VALYANLFSISIWRPRIFAQVRDSPQPTQAISQKGPNDPRQTGTGLISGTVINTSGGVVEGAHVTLRSSEDFNK